MKFPISLKKPKSKAQLEARSVATDSSQQMEAEARSEPLSTTSTEPEPKPEAASKFGIDTPVAIAETKKISNNDLVERITALNAELYEESAKLGKEKKARRKWYSNSIKLAQELKRHREATQPLLDAQKFAGQSWYEGGIWRAPLLQPGVSRSKPTEQALFRESVTLSDLFFNLVIVTAFTRVGDSVEDQNRLTIDPILYFVVVWMIWTKDVNYTSRFDSSDVSFQLVNLLTCFVTLFGSLSMTTSSIESLDGLRVMLMAAVVAGLHALLHLRIAICFGNTQDPPKVMARNYGWFTFVMTTLEAGVWLAGIFVPQVEGYRWAVFLLALLLSGRIPGAFMPNNFHGKICHQPVGDQIILGLFLLTHFLVASTKRGVLLTLLLGFILQSVIMVASPFYAYRTPTIENYAYFGCVCFFLYCIKLLFVDDTPPLTHDHALSLNTAAALFFTVGQLALLVATTLLGSGLQLLTHSYLVNTQVLPASTRERVFGGFAGVILSISFIKSMHVRRVPDNIKQKLLFLGAYAIQGMATIIVAVLSLEVFWSFSYLAFLEKNEVAIMFWLSSMAFFLVLMCWLDEAVELSLFTSDEDSREKMTQPLGFWCCVSAVHVVDRESKVPDGGDIEAFEEDEERPNLSPFSPLLSAATEGTDISEENMNYDTIGNNKV